MRSARRTSNCSFAKQRSAVGAPKCGQPLDPRDGLGVGVPDCCLFIGESEPLSETTTYEHPIPASIGGRIKSNRSVSDKFNTASSSTIDPVMSGLVVSVISRLRPLLSRTSRARIGAIPVTFADFPDVPDSRRVRGTIDMDGRTGLRGSVMVKDHTGRPVKMFGESAGLVARQTGMEPERVEDIRLPQISYFDQPAKLHPHLYAGIVRAIVGTLDCFQSTRLLARDTRLEPVRNAVWHAARARESSTPWPTARFPVGVLPVETAADMARFRQTLDGLPEPSLFEHQVFVWQDAKSRTLYGALSLFQTWLWRAQLAVDWEQPVAVVIANGVLHGGLSGHEDRPRLRTRIGRIMRRRPCALATDLYEVHAADGMDALKARSDQIWTPLHVAFARATIAAELDEQTCDRRMASDSSALLPNATNRHVVLARLTGLFVTPVETDVVLAVPDTPFDVGVAGACYRDLVRALVFDGWQVRGLVTDPTNRASPGVPLRVG